MTTSALQRGERSPIYFGFGKLPSSTRLSRVATETQSLAATCFRVSITGADAGVEGVGTASGAVVAKAWARPASAVIKAANLISVGAISAAAISAGSGSEKLNVAF